MPADAKRQAEQLRSGCRKLEGSPKEAVLLVVVARGEAGWSEEPCWPWLSTCLSPANLMTRRRNRTRSAIRRSAEA